MYYCLSSTKLPGSKYARSQSKKEKEIFSKNRMVVGYFGIRWSSLKWMTKVENSKTKKWPSGCTYKVADELVKTFRPQDIFSKAEQSTKLDQLKFKKG